MLTIITLSHLVSYIIMVLTIVYVGTHFTMYKRNFHQLLLINGISFLSLQLTLLNIIQNIQYDTYTLFYVKRFQTVGIYLYMLIIYFVSMFVLQNCKLLIYPVVKEKRLLKKTNTSTENCQSTTYINTKQFTMSIIIVLSSTTYLLSFGTFSIYKNILFTSIHTTDNIQKVIMFLSYGTIITILTIILLIIRRNFLYSLTIIMFVIHMIITYKLYNTGQLQYVISYSVSNIVTHLLYLLTIINIIKQLYMFFVTMEDIQ